MAKVKPKKTKKKIVESIEIMEEDGYISVAEMIELLEAQQAKYPDTCLSLEAYDEKDWYDSHTNHARLTMTSMVEI